MNQYLKDIQRLQDLIALKIMDTQPDEYLDELAELTSIICKTPAALISFIDDKRQWYKAKHGTSATEVPVEETICQYTINTHDILEFEDTLNEKILANNPHVQSENGVRYYAGINLFSNNGHAVGTLCTFNVVPQKLNEFQKEALRIIAKQVMFHVNKERENAILKEELKTLVNDKIAYAEKQLKVQEQAYDNLFNAIEKSNAVIEFDTRGKIVTVNENFLTIFGYTRDELIGKENTLLLDSEDIINNQMFWDSLRLGKPKSGKFKRLNKNGETIWIQASYSPVLDFNGNLVKITKIAQDITDEVTFQNKLYEAKKLADELNIQKDTFIANMSHELRTPLNAIVGFSDLLFSKESDTQKIQFLTAIKSASDSLLNLVNDILDVSKIESGLIDFNKDTFDLQEFIETIFNVHGLKAKQKKLEFNFNIDPNVPNLIIADKNRLIQVLHNLINNAIKFTNNGKIDLNVSISNNSINPVLKFEIKDTGIGIPKDKLQTIFSRFTQAETSTSRVYGGTGLGLNISKLIIENQGGTIGVASEFGQGSTFWFELPFEISKENTKESLVNTEFEIKKSKAKILICEDNELNILLMQSIFDETSYEIYFAENGVYALELLNQLTVDLILMDLQMPILDGYETTKQIRNSLHLNVPIIALTAHSLVNEKEKCFAIGMNDYLSKPFKKNELLSKVNSFLNKSDRPMFSIQNLEEYVGTNDELKKQMIALFLSSSEKEMLELNTVLENKNYERASQIVHKLKSSLGILSADLTLINDFEKALLTNNTNSIDILYNAFIKFINLLKNELENYLKLL